jgi:hypothetical protein
MSAGLASLRVLSAADRGPAHPPGPAASLRPAKPSPNRLRVPSRDRPGAHLIARAPGESSAEGRAAAPCQAAYAIRTIGLCGPEGFSRERAGEEGEAEGVQAARPRATRDGAVTRCTCDTTRPLCIVGLCKSTSAAPQSNILVCHVAGNRTAYQLCLQTAFVAEPRNECTTPAMPTLDAVRHKVSAAAMNNCCQRATMQRPQNTSRTHTHIVQCQHDTFTIQLTQNHYGSLHHSLDDKETKRPRDG